MTEAKKHCGIAAKPAASMGTVFDRLERALRHCRVAQLTQTEAMIRDAIRACPRPSDDELLEWALRAEDERQASALHGMVAELFSAELEPDDEHLIEAAQRLWERGDLDFDGRRVWHVG